MNAKELRIGNLLDRNGLIVKVGSNTILAIDDSPEILGKIYKPIQLTREWLFKSGFEEHSTNVFVQKEFVNNAKIKIVWSEKHGFQWCPNIWVRVNLPHVHTFQNLFFILNQELTIKENE